MNQMSSHAALIDSVVVAVSDLLARIEADAARCRPIDRTDDQLAIQRCLTSALALLGVSRTLLLKPLAPTPYDAVQHWDALIAQTKTAGRAAYQAALLLADRQTG